MSCQPCDPALSRALWERLHYSDPLHTLHRVLLDSDDVLLVIGDADNGAYEWVIQGAELRHSDCGYGDCNIALRDGLIAYYGLRDVHGAADSAKPSEGRL